MGMNAYQFDKPTPLTFIGGRWDGLTIEALMAPEIIHIDPTGQGLAPHDAYAVLPVGFTPYIRVGGPEPQTTYQLAEVA